MRFTTNATRAATPVALALASTLLILSISASAEAAEPPPDQPDPPAHVSGAHFPLLIPSGEKPGGVRIPGRALSGDRAPAGSVPAPPGPAAPENPTPSLNEAR